MKPTKKDLLKELNAMPVVVFDESESEVEVCCDNCIHFGTGDNWPCSDCIRNIHFKSKQT